MPVDYSINRLLGDTSMMSRFGIVLGLLVVLGQTQAEGAADVSHQSVPSVPPPSQLMLPTSKKCVSHVAKLISHACTKAVADMPSAQGKSPWRVNEVATIYCGQVDKGVAENLVHSVSKKYRDCPGGGAQPKESLHICDFTISANYKVKVRDVYHATCSP